MKEMKLGIGRMGLRTSEEEREWRGLSLLCTGDSVSFGEMTRHVEVYKRSGLKVNDDMSKDMELGGKEWLV